MDELLDLEAQGWRALSSSRDAATDFYSPLLADDAVMLFPGGMVIAGRDAILDAFGPQPWQSFQLEDQRVLHPHDDLGIVIYRVTARREGSDPYSALVSSTYVRRNGAWKLQLHQQTV